MKLPPILLLSVLAGLPVWAEIPFPLKDVQPSVIEPLKAREAGVIDEVSVRLGDEVEPGQIVARLEHDRQLHAYNVARVRHENEGVIDVAEGELKDKAALLDDMRRRYRRKAVSETQVAQAEAQYQIANGKLKQARATQKLAELELQLAEKLLERRFVRSTIRGTVITINRTPGDKAGEGDPVVVIADARLLSAVLPVTDEAAARLAREGSLLVKIGGTTATRVAQVAGVVPGANGSKLVRIVFGNDDPSVAKARQAYDVVLPAGIKPIPPVKEPARPPAKS